VKNLFCEKAVLTNEASVEQFFVNRLLEWLGYDDNRILPKTSIKELTIAKGSKKLRYKPDYVVLGAGMKPRWVIDAKSPSEDLADWTEQCASYCLSLNKGARKSDRATYFMLVNGLRTEVWEWDGGKPVLALSFGDFARGNAKAKALKALLGADAVDAGADAERAETVTFVRPSPSSINALFAACNNFIYKHDNVSPAAAFHEFVKVIFLKIRADRELHRKFPQQMEVGDPIPATEVPFSVRWLEGLEDQHPNPLDVQFQQLVDALEKEVAAGSKKRIFDKGERLTLQPDTAKAVVGMLESQDLFGIDEDLNGRLFETFLNSTMRGRELGQYFTPRSVVKLMVGLADLHATKNHVDSVIDPCCGTGGFLIEALAVMSREVSETGALSTGERNKLLTRIKEDAIFGIDVGREPPIARIARINMYLHGDGGSRIYIAEALDKTLEHQGYLSAETAAEVKELRRHLTDGGGFDVILTNPPFSKEYDPKVSNSRKLLAEYEVQGLVGKKASVRSSILFLERYADLLKPGGRVLAVIDDSILGGDRYAWARDFIRERFIVKAVISLPGDAFQRSGARVKTSVIYLVKKTGEEDAQGDVFMYYCTSVGVDDSARQRVLPEDALRREAAKKEVVAVVDAFQTSQQGNASRYLVPAARIADRLDVKSCLLKPGRKMSDWKKAELEVGPLSNWLDLREEESSADGDEIIQLLSVRYDGFPEQEPTIRSSIDYPRLYVAHAGDIVVSHINAVNGAIAVLPAEMDGAVVSTEYTVLSPRAGVDPYTVWSILRSPEVRAELMTRSTGLGRYRIRSDLLLAELNIPSPKTKAAVHRAKAFHDALTLEAKAQQLRNDAQTAIEQELRLRSEVAENIIAAFKPPR
jgi:type I restriction enzyme M protein